MISVILFILFSYLLWSLTSFCRYSCTYFMLELMYISRLFPVLRLNVRTWGYLRPAYVRRHNIPVLAGLGHYRVVLEPRFTPGVGNHLDQCSGSYQQYNQIQIRTHLYLNLEIPAMSTRMPFHWKFIPRCFSISSFQLSIRILWFFLVFFSSYGFQFSIFDSRHQFSTPRSL